jgi:hypothetical protein
MEALYLTLLSSIKYRTTVNTRTAGIGSRIQFATGLLSIIGLFDLFEIGGFQPLD